MNTCTATLDAYLGNLDAGGSADLLFEMQMAVRGTRAYGGLPALARVLGITHEAIKNAGGVGVLRITTEGRYFEPVAAGGDLAVVVPVYEIKDDGGAELTDLVAFRIDAPSRTWIRTGYARALGLWLLDSLHDVFAGDENKRPHARQFINARRDIAIACDAAVIVTAHPSLSGRASGTGEAGSTAWHNAVRSRLYLKTPPDEEDEDLRILATMKSNYGRKGREIRLRWTEGVFINIDGPTTGVVASIAKRNVDDVFLTLLGNLAAQDRPVSENPHARNYAPRFFAKNPNRQGFTRKDFEFSMERLFADGQILIEEYGRKSDMRRRIVTVNPNPKGGDNA